MFSGAEIAVVNDVIENVLPLTGRDMSELTHGLRGWRVARPQEEIIPYETVFLSDDAPTKADHERAKELALHMGGHNPPRELVEALAFPDQLKRIKLDVRRFDAIWESIVIDLARDPEGNPIVHEESGTRMIKTDAWGDDAPRFASSIRSTRAYLLALDRAQRDPPRIVGVVFLALISYQIFVS